MLCIALGRHDIAEILLKVAVSTKTKIKKSIKHCVRGDRRRVRRYQRGNQKRISKKNRQHHGQKKKVQKDKQRSTKHTHKTKYRETHTLQKIAGEFRCFENEGRHFLLH